MGTWRHWVPALLAGGVTWLVARFAEDWAHRRELLDIPNPRSSHHRPTPRLGGAGLVAGIVAACLWLAATSAAPVEPRLGVFLLIGLALAAVGFVDDVRGVAAPIRLGLQTIAGIGAVWFVSPPAAVPGIAGVFAVVLGVLWIVAFVNAFNFMDGIDGIAGAQALVAGLGWTALGAALGDGAVRALGIVIAGSAAGFLLLNWSPARIFMGDGGSSFLGYLLAGVPLAAQDTLGVAVPAFFIVWPFLFDTAVTLVRRAARGENLMQAHRNHLYQRLTQSGWTHARVASLYGGLSAWGAVVGWWALAVENSARGWFLASASVAVLAACLWTIVERRAISRSSA